jgi:hypothetical protein
MLAKPDPALGYLNGELRFWLGWAQGSRQRSCRRSGNLATGAQRKLNLSQRTAEKSELIEYLALTTSVTVTKPAFSLLKKAMAVVPIEKDARWLIN